MDRGEKLELNAPQDEIRLFLVWLWLLGFLVDIISEQNFENCFSPSFESRGEECHETGLRLSRIRDYGLSRILYNLGIERGTGFESHNGIMILMSSWPVDIRGQWRSICWTTSMYSQDTHECSLIRVRGMFCVNNNSGKQQNKHPQF